MNIPTEESRSGYRKRLHYASWEVSKRVGRGLRSRMSFFLDIVGYSKRLTDEQSEALQELNHVVRSTEATRQAEAAGELTILPTGDGMALVFTGSVEEPVECALEISEALRPAESAGENGNPQRPGASGQRRERARKHRRRWHQHRAKGDGLRRCRSHSREQTCGR